LTLRSGSYRRRYVERVARLLLVVIILVVAGWITSTVCRNKGGDPRIGFALGFVLGLIGLAVALAAPPAVVSRWHLRPRAVRR
jgi:uncharacterized membrane protein YeaQ/YmgE (transglycosylase-associated protein family)